VDDRGLGRYIVYFHLIASGGVSCPYPLFCTRADRRTCAKRVRGPSGIA
jgi:hypothetical protein